MAKLVVNNEIADNKESLIKICPFGALELKENKIEVSAACKMCRVCVKKGPAGVFELIEEVTCIDKSEWKGIAVFVEHTGSEIHPVTLELLGKARELANKLNFPVYCVYPGYQIQQQAEELLYYGADEIFVYDNIALENFQIEPYTAVCEDFINQLKPSTMLIGATVLGRSLAPRIAARFRTGLTADCTILDVKDNTDLIQIRPAFGGNIMAQIITPNSRPQLATVRYKVMNAPEKSNEKTGKITACSLPTEKLVSGIEVLQVVAKHKENSISDAEVIIVAGRGIKNEKDLAMLKDLAKALGGQIAATRPLIEAGWVNAKQQIGLSGRTVRPKLIITCGVSGAVQFTAGMNNADTIIAINKDDKAPIFKLAHYCLVGDIYEIVPQLISKLQGTGGEVA